VERATGDEPLNSVVPVSQDYVASKMPATFAQSLTVWITPSQGGITIVSCIARLRRTSPSGTLMVCWLGEEYLCGRVMWGGGTKCSIQGSFSCIEWTLCSIQAISQGYCVTGTGSGIRQDEMRLVVDW